MYVFTQFFCLPLLDVGCTFVCIYVLGAVIGGKEMLTDLNNRKVYSARLDHRAKARTRLKRVSSWRI